MDDRSDATVRPPSRPPLVRRATPGDLGSLVALLEEIMADHGHRDVDRPRLRSTLNAILAGGIPADAATERTVDASRTDHVTDSGQRPEPHEGDADHLFLVVEAEGRVVGACALLFSTSTWSAARVCELQDVIVSAPFRGRGHGRALLEAAVEAARSAGCVRVFLTAEAVNLPAHAFYRSLGFAEKTVLYFERST